MTPSTLAAGEDRAERQAIPLPSGPDSPTCPKCGGPMWDNRVSKRNPKAPDFKCRNRACDGVLWPGQHRTIIPVTRLPRLAEVSDGGQTPEGNDEPAFALLPILRRKYLDLTDFVLDIVRPKYEEHG